jgi:hypothetical protein
MNGNCLWGDIGRVCQFNLMIYIVFLFVLKTKRNKKIQEASNVSLRGRQSHNLPGRTSSSRLTHKAAPAKPLSLRTVTALFELAALFKR